MREGGREGGWKNRKIEGWGIMERERGEGGGMGENY